MINDVFLDDTNEVWCRDLRLVEDIDELSFKQSIVMVNNFCRADVN